MFSVMNTFYFHLCQREGVSSHLPHEPSISLWNKNVHFFRGVRHPLPQSWIRPCCEYLCVSKGFLRLLSQDQILNSSWVHGKKGSLTAQPIYPFTSPFYFILFSLFLILFIYFFVSCCITKNANTKYIHVMYKSSKNLYWVLMFHVLCIFPLLNYCLLFAGWSIPWCTTQYSRSIYLLQTRRWICK